MDNPYLPIVPLSLGEKEVDPMYTIGYMVEKMSKRAQFLEYLTKLDGVSLEEIARNFEMSSKTVRNIVESLGVDAVGIVQGKLQLRIPIEELAQLVKQNKQPSRIQDISDRHQLQSPSSQNRRSREEDYLDELPESGYKRGSHLLPTISDLQRLSEAEYLRAERQLRRDIQDGFRPKGRTRA